MPLLCRGERLVCKDGDAECAFAVTRLLPGSAPHATIETINAEGLALRVRSADPSEESVPLYITRAGRIVVNAGRLPADDDPGVRDCNMRVFGTVRADAYLNLPRTVLDVSVSQASGSVTVTFTDGATVTAPAPYATALSALAASVVELQGQRADLEARVSALEQPP